MSRLTKSELKAVIQKIKAGPCPMCKTYGPIEFHHLDPSKKKMTIGTAMGKGKNILLRELEKCTPLCTGCHKFVDTMIGSRPEKYAYPADYYLGGLKPRNLYD